jgi:hypothetical protein
MSNLQGLLAALGVKDEKEFARMFGGHIVDIGGKSYMSIPPPAPASAPVSYGKVVCSTKTGIVGIISTKFNQSYFVGVPEGHPWFHKKASYFNSLDDTISKYGTVTETDADSIEKNGKIMRSISIEITMESFSDKRKRYWIQWECNVPSEPGLFELLKKEVNRICENANKHK